MLRFALEAKGLAKYLTSCLGRWWPKEKKMKKANLKEKITAPGEDRTRDLSLTKRTHYHYATEAGFNDKRYIKYIS